MKKRQQLVLVVASAGLLLAGCGGSESATTDKSETKVAKSTSADLTTDTLIPAIFKAQQKAKTSHMSMLLELSGQKIKAEGDVVIGASAADSKVSMKMDMAAMGAGTVEMRFVDKVFYMNLGPLSDNKFAKIDTTDKNNPLGAQFGDLLDQMDPTTQLQQMSDAVTDARKKGDPITLDGVKAQPYQLRVDTTKLDSLKKLPEASKAQLPKTLTYTMYIGPDNLIRRLVTDVVGTKATTEYSKWGKSVDIQAPTKDQITDSDFMDKLGTVPS